MTDEIDKKLKSVCEFWFCDLNYKVPLGKDNPKTKIWFAKSNKTDAFIKQNFQELLENLENKINKGWRPLDFEQTLGVIIVFDQFSRNMFRNQAKMFANDHLALGLTKDFIKNNYIWDNDLFHNLFLCMPLMHSENLADQNLMLEHSNLFVEHALKNNSPNVAYFENSLNFARRHKEIIEKFGRFPHRNEILGRQSTIEEAEFLQTPNSSF